jgi:hypothetical protein
MDLNPLGGQYRLQAAVGPVEVNALRATLGVRPIPFPIAGALRGVLHLTGPLEKPIFSGSASALRPPPALLVGVEDTPALQALLADPSAVVAYDRVPASAANGVSDCCMLRGGRQHVEVAHVSSNPLHQVR